MTHPIPERINHRCISGVERYSIQIDPGIAAIVLASWLLNLLPKHPGCTWTSNCTPLLLNPSLSMPSQCSVNGGMAPSGIGLNSWTNDGVLPVFAPRAESTTVRVRLASVPIHPSRPSTASALLRVGRLMPSCADSALSPGSPERHSPAWILRFSRSEAAMTSEGRAKACWRLSSMFIWSQLFTSS